MDVHAACDPEAIQCGQRAAKNQEHLWGWGTHATAAPLLPEGFHDSQSPYGYQDNVQPPVDINILRLKTPTVEASCWPQDQNGRNSTSWHKKRAAALFVMYLQIELAPFLAWYLQCYQQCFHCFHISKLQRSILESQRGPRGWAICARFFRPRQKRANPPFFNFLGC